MSRDLRRTGGDSVFLVSHIPFFDRRIAYGKEFHIFKSRINERHLRITGTRKVLTRVTAFPSANYILHLFPYIFLRGGLVNASTYGAILSLLKSENQRASKEIAHNLSRPLDQSFPTTDNISQRLRILA